MKDESCYHLSGGYFWEASERFSEVPAGSSPSACEPQGSMPSSWLFLFPWFTLPTPTGLHPRATLPLNSCPRLCFQGVPVPRRPRELEIALWGVGGDTA